MQKFVIVSQSFGRVPEKLCDSLHQFGISDPTYKSAEEVPRISLGDVFILGTLQSGDKVPHRIQAIVDSLFSPPRVLIAFKYS